MITAAAPGDVIFICAGTYTEQLTINKPLTLLGAQWGQDARTGRTDPAAETVLNATNVAPAGVIVYTTGATTGTLDGLTLQNADGTAVNGINNATANAYTFQNNIITGNTTGMNFHTVGPDVTAHHAEPVRRTTIGAGQNTGTSIFITNGPVIGMLVEDNLFQGNVGGARRHQHPRCRRTEHRHHDPEQHERRRRHVRGDQ